MDADHPSLFNLPPAEEPEPRVRSLESPLWTEHKAHLIERYLYYFVLVTKHGNYLDGFAGPQEPDRPEMWAAKLVLESEPRWLRKFFLFDADPAQLERLEALKRSQPPLSAPRREPRRMIDVIHGDFNIRVRDVLASGVIGENEATFCLLDQRTFECHWSTLAALAGYKAGRKIELFYFLPNAWLDRALVALKDTQVVERWWGRPDWDQLRRLPGQKRAERFAVRFKSELGYWSVKPWPIFERQSRSRLMYYMIHATDHPDAPGLMARAYSKAVQPREPAEQLALELGLGSFEPPES